jgi:hypothetical protein
VTGPILKGLNLPTCSSNSNYKIKFHVVNLNGQVLNGVKGRARQVLEVYNILKCRNLPTGQGG